MSDLSRRPSGQPAGYSEEAGLGESPVSPHQDDCRPDEQKGDDDVEQG
jgi:hypothetical protein